MRNSFLNLTFKFHSIHPKMSRDFSIKFSSKDDRDDAFDILSKILVNQRSPLFESLIKGKMKFSSHLPIPKRFLKMTILFLEITS